MLAVATALMRRSTCAASKANPPLPQMPMAPILFLSTKGRVPRKSTPALKSSVKISEDEICRGSPQLSPLKDSSKAMAHRKPAFMHMLQNSILGPFLYTKYKLLILIDNCE
ncbi:hypothetical protein [Pseudodesulfovibrio tunisiensis]|uniref:hypothetical protein n=1 Tax=Pseudodesulfovibrio tunisiensis TaxID=463192 RepID=UPI001FB3D021|nr:hypothetical protein [Pseudodesulfovibrio tunisiensis]